MKSPHADKYWKAAVKDTGTSGPFKFYPHGPVKNFKACLSVCGNQQVYNVDFFETFARVVQWTTILLMLTLEVLCVLKSK
eukprot:CCRYP_006743-RA/>CCRYP_006743-RA protein AED:0.29 eAED:0.29 QI:0/0/0/1/0/0/2/0/79